MVVSPEHLSIATEAAGVHSSTSHALVSARASDATPSVAALATPVSMPVATYYINLTRRPDRNRHCLQHLARHVSTATLTRFEAIDGSAAGLAADPRLFVFYDTEENHKWDPSISWFRHHRLSAGEIGCCLSHRTLWEKLHADNTGPVLVFEDDAVLHPDFHREFGTAYTALPPDWDIFYVGYILPAGGLRVEPVRDRVHRVTFVFGTYGYVLSVRGVAKLMSQLPIDRPIDNFLGKLTECGVLTGYAVYPPIVQQFEYGGAGSDITHTSHLG
tara:strand:- start:779 stop:1597 length:819 start_codon:yes stop_codon:yes gene_type:complete